MAELPFHSLTLPSLPLSVLSKSHLPLSMAQANKEPKGKVQRLRRGSLGTET